MKKCFLCLCLLTVIKISAQTDVTYTIESLEEGDEIYLGYHLADQKYVEDTLQVGPRGSVRMVYEDQLKPGLYFLYSPPKFYQEFIINEPRFTINTEGNGYETFKASGSEENDFFATFQLEIGKRQRERSQLADSLKSLTGKDSIALVEELKNLTNEYRKVQRELVASKPDLLVAKMVNLMIPVEPVSFPEIEDDAERRRKEYLKYRQDFRVRLDFKERGLLRTPVFKSSVLKYTSNVIPQIPDSIIAEVDRIMDEVAVDSTSFRFWLVTFTSTYENHKTMGMDKVFIHILEKYYLAGRAYWVDEETIKKMREEVYFVKPNLIGNLAPQLNLLDTTFTNVNVFNLPEDYLVLYFYDPGCGVCKKKTPILKNVYYDLKDSNAEVVAICGTTDVDKWKTYIIKNELDWLNLADPYTTSNFRAEYNIRSFPQVFILNKDRRIIAKRLGVEQVKGFINDHQTFFNK